MYVWINNSSDSFSRCNRPLKYSRIDKYGIHCINPSITAKTQPIMLFSDWENLELRNNPIGGYGAKALAQALSNGSTLRCDVSIF